MKRKYLHSVNPKKGKGDEEIRSLSDGIPRLRRTISETGPSIPSEDEHAAVSWQEKPFGLISENVWDLIKDRPSRLFTQGGNIVYSSENDIAGLVKSYILAIVGALGLGNSVELHSEIGTFQIRPDRWLVSVHGVPIGVVEVKKPDVPRKPAALFHPNVLGELFDFMKHLPNYFGVSPVFGIVTNLNAWRFAWLPGDAVDEMVAEEENPLDYETGQNFEDEDAFRQPSSPLHALVHDVEDPKEEDCDELDSTVPYFHVSRVFKKTDNSTLVRAIASVVCKMLRSRVHPFATPFDKLNERTILKFEKGGAKKRVAWTRLKNVAPKWDSIAAPKKYLFAIQDLGRGADGRVWLMCSSSGAVCVLKFSLSDKLGDTTAEANIWKVAYPDIPVHVELWCGHPALRMPHFSMVDDADKSGKIELVKKSLQEDFANKGLKHNDVFWRNIGLFKDLDGSDHIVVFDMKSVVNSPPGEDAWVDEACEALASAGKEPIEDDEDDEYLP